MLLAPCPTLQAGGPTLVGCPRLLIQYILSYPPYWRSFLHPQPEDAQCYIYLSYVLLDMTYKIKKYIREMHKLYLNST